MKFSALFVGTCCVLALLAGLVEARHQQSHELTFRTAAPRQPQQHSKRMADNSEQDNKIPDEPQGAKQASDSEAAAAADQRITIGEPYKSILQTTARFALAQTQVTKHLNIDTAMNLLSDIGYFLSKPMVLLKAVKVVVISMATLMFTLIFFPGAGKFVEAAWQDPMGALNLDRYLTNGLEERSVLAAIGSRTDETLARVGLQDNSCRQRSICYMGEIMKCSFPHTADTITKFASENFASSSIKDNVYARAFIAGFVDKNCTNVGTMSQQDTNSCLGNFFNSILNGANGAVGGGNSRSSGAAGGAVANKKRKK